MGKKEVLPHTKAGSAEERLEELVKNKTLLRCRLLTNNKDYSLCIINGEFRFYPDGFETIEPDDSQQGGLYLARRNILVFYDSKKEWEKQNYKGLVQEDEKWERRN